MDDNGYTRPELWLSEGWTTIREQGWRAPLYWQPDPDTHSGWRIYTLHGWQPLDDLSETPVCHLSFFEADAYARWAARHTPGCPPPHRIRVGVRRQPSSAPSFAAPPSTRNSSPTPSPPRPWAPRLARHSVPIVQLHRKRGPRRAVSRWVQNGSNNSVVVATPANLLETGALHPTRASARLRPATDLRRRLGVDLLRLHRLPRLPPPPRSPRRIQRQIHVLADGPPRRLLRHSRHPHPRHLPKLLLARPPAGSSPASAWRATANSCSRRRRADAARSRRWQARLSAKDESTRSGSACASRAFSCTLLPHPIRSDPSTCPPWPSRAFGCLNIRTGFFEEGT